MSSDQQSGTGSFRRRIVEENKTSTAPQFATENPNISQNSFKIRVAIDFGTDGIGIFHDSPYH